MTIDAKQLVKDVQNIKIRITGMDSSSAFIRKFVEDEMIQRLDEIKEMHRSMNRIRNNCQALVDQYKDAEKYLKQFKRFKSELAEFKKTINDKFKLKEKDKQAEYDKHKKDVKIGRPKKVKIAQETSAS